MKGFVNIVEKEAIGIILMIIGNKRCSFTVKTAQKMFDKKKVANCWSPVTWFIAVFTGLTTCFLQDQG